MSYAQRQTMPYIFLAEAVNTITYILNRNPTRTIKAWSGAALDISHVKVFGSMCYAHAPDEKRSKLDDKSERCIFMGYENSNKGIGYIISKRKGYNQQRCCV